MDSSIYDTNIMMTDAQLRAELNKCEYCEDQPCLEACPSHCSPTDFIRAAKGGAASDYQRATAMIMSQNPLGGICGVVCPDFHCMSACVLRKFNGAVDIPRVQATIVQRAKDLGVMPTFASVDPSGKRIAVVGAGPAGLAAAALLARQGHTVTIYEAGSEPGGMCNCIPDFRLPRDVISSDIDWLRALGDVNLELNRRVETPDELLQDADAVVVAVGIWEPIAMGIPGEELALGAVDLLRSPDDHDLVGKNVAIIGGGAVAVDCAETAIQRGARGVEMFALEVLEEMPLTAKEMQGLVHSGVDVTGRIQVTAVQAGQGGQVAGISTRKVRLAKGARFNLKDIHPIEGTEASREDIDTVVKAIGLRSAFFRVEDPRVFYAGDCAEGPSTVVEAAAAGKNTAEAVCAFLDGRKPPVFERGVTGRLKGFAQLPGYNRLPVPLDTHFFGRAISSPFLLSAAPPTDGLEQMRLAYESGWAGGIMKTAFDGLPIHIPGEYMFQFAPTTYANCDNVSGHSLDRVCQEVELLVRQYPDCLTIGSTGGPVSGDDEADRRQWLSNTAKLENAGAMGIEYSLSCPQGGDGTEGDIVSQSAALTAKIVDWIMAGGDGSVPKLFKLTGAVTSIGVIVSAVKEVLQRYPDKAGGITLANSFPTLGFRAGDKQTWEEGVVAGASGDGILNISYLSLASVSHLGLHISGNGGPMDYKAAANFLALGCRTVQLCTLVMKYGYGIIDEMTSGVSHLMAARGITDLEQLIGIALPDPITDFMALTPTKKISQADPELCLRCGNCTRCPYLAINYDDSGDLFTDPSRCVGCSICSKKCFSQAITMRPRTAEEAAALRED